MSSGAASESRDASSAPQLDEGLLCPDCAYDLRGLTGDRCPECGFSLAPLRRHESLLPWRCRHEIGWFRGFWRTVWLVSAHPRRLAIEVIAEQPVAEARRFWLIACLHLVPLLLAAIGSLVHALGMLQFTGNTAWVICGSVFVITAWFWLLPGVATYMLQSHRVPPEHERRVWAISIYTWSILLWAAPAALACIFVSLLLPISGPTGGWGVLAILCLLVPPLVFLQRRLYVICRRLLHVGRMAAIMRIASIEFAAIVMALVLLLFPLGVYFLCVVALSLN